MPKKLFIGYVTATGSTKDTAEEIGRVLEARGFEAKVQPIAEAAGLDSYDAFVIGAPVNGMAWHPSALAFVKANREILAKRPTAYFLLSIAYGAGREAMKKLIPARLDPPSAIVAPFARGCFGGVMRSAPPFVIRLAFGIGKDAPRDSRDHGEIEAWAEDLAAKLA